MLLLELDHATVVRGGRRILDDLTLTIPVGRHTAILGPNGSGKSSLIRLITRDYYPLALRNGHAPIKLMGKERWEVSALRSQFGIVTSDLERVFAAEDARSGLEVVLSGFFASHGVYRHHKVSETMREKAEHALKLMGALSLAGKTVNHMSSGEARRILIARALVPDPCALLLDEPSAGLDLVARRRFLERLRGICREGTTVLLVTHHVEEILPEINHVILLKNGRVFRDGPKRDCLTGDVFSELLDADVTVEESKGYYSAQIA